MWSTKAVAPNSVVFSINGSPHWVGMRVAGERMARDNTRVPVGRLGYHWRIRSRLCSRWLGWVVRCMSQNTLEGGSG